MAKERFNWWPFVLNMIHDYPDRKLECCDLHQQEQKEFDAVRKAIEHTRMMKDGAIRMKIIDLTLWKRYTTIAGAAMRLGISERTAQRYRWQFVILVGHKYGFLTEEEYNQQVQKELGNKKRNPMD